MRMRHVLMTMISRRLRDRLLAHPLGTGCPNGERGIGYALGLDAGIDCPYSGFPGRHGGYS